MIRSCPKCQKKFDYQKRIYWRPKPMDCPHCGIHLTVSSNIQFLYGLMLILGFPAILINLRLDGSVLQVYFTVIAGAIFLIIHFSYRNSLKFEIDDASDKSAPDGKP